MNKLLDTLYQQRGDVTVLTAKWITPVATLFAGLLTARFLEPDDLGVIQSVMLIQVYCGFLHGGVFNGLNRNIPLFKGIGQIDRVQCYVDASYAIARITGIVGALVSTVAAGFFYVYADSPLYFRVCLFLIPGMFFAPRRIHIDTVYRGTRSFSRLGIGMHIQNILNVVVAAMTAFAGVYAAAFRSACMPLFGLRYLYRNPPLTPIHSAKMKDVAALAKVGFPMMVSGLIFMWMNVADRTIIAMELPSKQLGYFALATITTTAMRALCEPVNQLLYPRVAHCFGEKGSSRFLRRYIWLGLFLNFILLLPVVGAGWLLIPVLVKTFLPQYAPGIQAAQISLLGSLCYIYTGPSVIIPIVRKNLPYQLAGLFSLGFVWMGGLWAVRNGYGIEGVTIARVSATAFFALFVIVFMFYLTWADIPCEHEQKE
jgi:O-antigen/teichoic acid export membrane protein